MPCFHAQQVMCGFTMWAARFALLAIAAAAPAPALLTLNASLIAQSQARIAAGDPSVAAAYATAVRRGDENLALGPWSIVNCTLARPSGDPHDYVSVSTYYWPCNANPCGANATVCGADGLPWVR